MTDSLSSDQNITLEQHRRILFEIRTKVAAVNLDLGCYQDPDHTGEELDAVCEWIDQLRGAP